jgi:hypothetical protein
MLPLGAPVPVLKLPPNEMTEPMSPTTMPVGLSSNDIRPIRTVDDAEFPPACTPMLLLEDIARPFECGCCHSVVTMMAFWSPGKFRNTRFRVIEWSSLESGRVAGDTEAAGSSSFAAQGLVGQGWAWDDEAGCWQSAFCAVRLINSRVSDLALKIDLMPIKQAARD